MVKWAKITLLKAFQKVLVLGTFFLGLKAPEDLAIFMVIQTLYDFPLAEMGVSIFDHQKANTL